MSQAALVFILREPQLKKGTLAKWDRAQPRPQSPEQASQLPAMLLVLLLGTVPSRRRTGAWLPSPRSFSFLPVLGCRNLPDVSAKDFEKVDLTRFKWIHIEASPALPVFSRGLACQALARSVSLFRDFLEP